METNIANKASATKFGHSEGWFGNSVCESTCLVREVGII